MLSNIVTNLVTRMQEITGNFRVSQGTYLRKVEAREQRNNQYFTSFSQDDEVFLILNVIKYNMHNFHFAVLQ